MARRTKEEDPVETLARCIVFLDDSRAYRRKDVEQMEQTFSRLKKTRFTEHYDLWVKVRPSVERIVDMPMKVNGVPKMIGRLSWLKVLNRVALIALVLFIAVLLVPVWRRVIGPEPFGGNEFAYATVAVLIVVVSMNIATWMDFRIRKRIIVYEGETQDEYARDRDRLRDGANRMLKSLAQEAKRAGNTPEDFALVLYFDDYENVKVVNHWKPRSLGIFKKPYSLYQVVPKY